MTQDYSGCKFYIQNVIGSYGEEIFDACSFEDDYKSCECIICKNYQLNSSEKLILTQNKLKKTEHQLKLVNQDNDALSRYCEMLEKKIAHLANMQDKKVILE